MRIENKGLKEEKRIYNVSELTEDVKVLLENTFPEVWVEGEVSNFSQSQSGHIYFSLKDAKSSLRCVFFRGANSALKFSIKDGLKVIAFGRITVYSPAGQYQLNIQRLEPKGTGALQIAFEQLKERLSREGLFDEAHKKRLPVLPLRIGVVTSPVGAAIRDILNILRQRAPFVKVILSPVKVQGEGAPEEIAGAISEFNQYEDVEVLIVGRGGGSSEELWAFNEEIVARAIYNSKIPVISAVGHEVDWTISDFVADMRAATPTAAAMLVARQKEDLAVEIGHLLSRMNACINNKISFLHKELRALKEAYVLKYPLNFIQVYLQRIDELNRRLHQRFGHTLEVWQNRATHLTEKLGVLSPLSILSRGYSITFKLPEMKVITDTAEVKISDQLKTRLRSGSFVSEVVSRSLQ
jgi:exodeoxyribonuclease VII large subunit